MEASESDEDGCRLFRLGDDEFGLQLAIDEPTARVALLLEGECTPAALAAGSGLDGAQVERAVRQLRRFFLLDDAAAAELVAEVRATRSWQSTPPHQVPLLVRPDARFACVACGSCCGLQSIGPIRPEELEAIWQHREALHGKIPADGGLFHSVSCGSAGSGGPRVICRLRDGYCVFLAGDRRCLIHRELGAEVKPACCRIFPLQFVATPDGVAVSLNMECRGFLQARCGPPLTDQQDELRRTLSLLPSLRRLRPVILIDEQRSCGYRAYAELEQALHAAVDGVPASAGASLLAMRAVLEQRRGRLPAAGAEEGDALPALRRDLAELVQALQEGLTRLHLRFARNDPGQVVHTGSLTLIGSALGGLCRSLRQLPAPLEGEQRELFAELVHHQLTSKQWTEAPTLVHGLARLAFSWSVIVALARQLAQEVKRIGADAQGLLDAIVLVNFVWKDKDFAAELARHDHALVALFHDRLPALLRLADALPDDEPDTQIYKY